MSYIIFIIIYYNGGLACCVNAALPISASSGRYEYFLFQYLRTRSIGVFVVQAPIPTQDFWDHVPPHNKTSPYNYSCSQVKSGYPFCQRPCNMCTKPRSTRLIEAAIDKAGEFKVCTFCCWLIVVLNC